MDDQTIVGFTGTRRGMTGDQAATIHRLLRQQKGEVVVHHGDCVGADAQMHELARMLGAAIVIHPPVDDTYRAWCEGPAVMYKPRPYIDRNHMIVRTCELLIATPQQQHEITRSGTWATVRYARKKGKEIYVIYPEGQIRHEEAKWA